MFDVVIPLFIGILTVLLSGYFAVSLIDRDMVLRFRVLFAVPMGFALHSIFYFVYQCLGLYNFQNFKIFEYAFVLILAICYYNQNRPDFSKHKFHRLNNWFYVLNVFGLSMFMKYFLNNPMGSWDGFRIWNTKAQYLFLQTPQWKQMFTLPHYLSHGDYPLFLPLSTARLWQYIGAENYFSNMVLGLIFTFAVVYLLFQAVSYFKSEKIAYIVCSVLAVADIFMVNGAAQGADVPLALFFLSAVVCLFIFFKNNRFSSLVLGIIFAGLSIWVKNEGMMFFAIYLLTIAGYFAFKKDLKKLFFVSLVALPFVCGVFVYKKFINVQNDIVLGFFVAKTYRFAFDLNRYLIVLKTFTDMMLHQFVLFLALFILCVKGFKIRDKVKYPVILSSLMLLFMALGYVFVYVLSPHDVKWLAENSLDRIIIQILPVFLLIFSTVLRIGKPDTLN